MTSQRPSPRILVRFRSMYMGEASYDVYNDGEPYRIARRFFAPEYDPRIFRYTAAEYEREIVGAVGIVHRQGEPVRPEVLLALRPEEERAGAEVPGVTGRYVTGVGWERFEPELSVAAE